VVTSGEGTQMPDLLVISHLRWNWVWQRPQHIVSRMAAHRSHRGAQTWFVEYPAFDDVDEPTLNREIVDGICRLWMSVPRNDRYGDCELDAIDPHWLAQQVRRLVYRDSRLRPDILLYTPMGTELAELVGWRSLAYDVMDNLQYFHNSSPMLPAMQDRLLAKADVVFTGGVSLHQSILERRSQSCHLFSSGVDSQHYAGAARLRSGRATKVAGYIGVIDERLDYKLLLDLARSLADWTIRLVGPVAKVELETLPKRRNIEYLGLVSYKELPRILSGFDVGLMPFALTAATREISPTKTLEYLAAGLPVVSTPVPDVVANFSAAVEFAASGRSFATACRRALEEPAPDRVRSTSRLLASQEWSVIAAEMIKLIEGSGAGIRG